jgi:5-methylcytosine-specific restriction endonuclease McrA
MLESLEIDHIIPLAEGGRDDESNWALLHKECNRKKGSKLSTNRGSKFNEYNTSSEFSCYL